MEVWYSSLLVGLNKYHHFVDLYEQYSFIDAYVKRRDGRIKWQDESNNRGIEFMGAQYIYE